MRPLVRGQVEEMMSRSVLALDSVDAGVGEVMARPLPQLDVSVHLDEAYRLLLSGNTGVLAVSNGQVLDIVTRIDLVHYWNQARGR